MRTIGRMRAMLSRLPMSRRDPLDQKGESRPKTY